MYIVSMSILFILLAGMAVAGALSEKRDKGAALTETQKCKGYLQSIALLWGLLVVIVVMCIMGNISRADIGLRPVSFQHNIWFTVITLIISGVMFAFFVYQTILLLTSAKARAEARRQIVTGEGVGRSLPRTKKEKRFFSLLSLSAGVCEEIIFRGFLAFLLQAIFPTLPIYLIVLITSIIFGLAHIYQGLQGVMKTLAFGALLMCLVSVTNSLLLAMLLHFFLDLSSAFLLSDEQGEPGEQSGQSEQK